MDRRDIDLNFPSAPSPPPSPQAAPIPTQPRLPWQPIRPQSSSSWMQVPDNIRALEPIRHVTQHQPATPLYFPQTIPHYNNNTTNPNHLSQSFTPSFSGSQPRVLSRPPQPPSSQPLQATLRGGIYPIRSVPPQTPPHPPSLILSPPQPPSSQPLQATLWGGTYPIRSVPPQTPPHPSSLILSPPQTPSSQPLQATLWGGTYPIRSVPLRTRRHPSPLIQLLQARQLRNNMYRIQSIQPQPLQPLPPRPPPLMLPGTSSGVRNNGECSTCTSVQEHTPANNIDQLDRGKSVVNMEQHVVPSRDRKGKQPMEQQASLGSTLGLNIVETSSRMDIDNEISSARSRGGSSSRGRGRGRGRDRGRGRGQDNENPTPRRVWKPRVCNDGDTESVQKTLMIFEGLRRSMDDKLPPKMFGRRKPKADVEAGKLIMDTGLNVNYQKRVGHVSGIEIGDVFFTRFEMCVVGLNGQIMTCIDYMKIRDNFIIAVSIVTSAIEGELLEEDSDGQVIVICGEGGRSNKHQTSDQELLKGNLAMKNSVGEENPVRVIRGVKDLGRPNSNTVYIYDGLFRIIASWVMIDKNGFKVFKYRLERLPGQARGYSIWKTTQFWKQNPSLRPGLIVPNITSWNQEQLHVPVVNEKVPIPVVNDVDDERPPSFRYITECIRSEKSKTIDSTKKPPRKGCECLVICVSDDNNSCNCIQSNRGNLSYTLSGSLLAYKPIIQECDSTCSCQLSCQMRISQNGVKCILEIFRTLKTGWGLRSWDPIRTGAFVCEYVGTLVEDIFEFDLVRSDFYDNEYIFDTKFAGKNSTDWNHNPKLFLKEGEEEQMNIDEEDEDQVKIPNLILKSKYMGNVARFLNHSCSPNLFWQLIRRGHGDESSLHVAFFALRNIPPLTELTFDYGFSDIELKRRKTICSCGSPKCKGLFG